MAMGFMYRTKKKGEAFYLHKKLVLLRSKKEQLIYYFSRTLDEAHYAVMPEGYSVWENPNTGMPLLKKDGSKGGE